MFSKFFTFSLSALIALIFMGTASICLAQGNTWIIKADMQTPRTQHGTCVVNGKIYSIAGVPTFDCPDPATQKVEEYDPSTNTWDTTKTPIPTARQGLAISAVDGKIYVVGGHPVLCEGELSTVEVYDPLTDTWDTTKTPMPTPRGGLSTSVVNDTIYAIGGFNYSSNVALADVEAYDPITDTWIPRAPMPTVRTWLSTCVVDGKIYAFGGHGNGPPWVSLKTVEVYDPVTNIWTQLNDMPIEIQNTAASTVAGSIYLFGGASQPTIVPVSDVWQYNPILDTMIIITQMPLARAGAHSSELNGEIYVIGGWNTSYQPTTTVQAYTPQFSLPSIPELVYPGGSIDTTAVEFVWTMSNPFVTRYWFEIATDNQFTNSFIDSTITDTTYLYSNLNNSESYWWRVKAYNAMGWGEFSEVTMFTVNITSVEEDNQLPTLFSLQQNYPNPFNPMTTINYQIPELSFVTLKVYDVLGSDIATLINEEKTVGNYEVEFDATNLPSGIYFYRLQAGSFIETRKMILMK